MRSHTLNFSQNDSGPCRKSEMMILSSHGPTGRRCVYNISLSVSDNFQRFSIQGLNVHCSNIITDNLLCSGNVEMVELLLRHGGDKQALMGVPASITPCTLAEDMGHTEILEVLNNI